MPLNNILVVEVVDVWGVYLIGPFSPSERIEYILVTIDYVSKLVKVVSLSREWFKGGD